MCSQSLSSCLKERMSLSDKSFGCDVTNLILSKPLISLILFNRSGNEFRLFFVLLYELTFCPRSVISLTPESTSLRISLIISVESLLFSGPLTYGTIQYVQ